jgi:8-oxo-dGTP pyrophosphatase MutT (NUDIX family)
MIYNEQPEGFVPDMEVVTCLIKIDNKILLLHRNDSKKEGNKWGPPGGKIDKEDSSRIMAMLRELKEETGLSLNENELSFHKTFFVSHLGDNFLYHYFNCNLKEVPEIIISESEHKAFAWVTPQEALNMSLVLDEDHCLKDYFGMN